MAWFDASGPDFWTLGFSSFAGPTTAGVSTSWNGTEADLVIPGGYGNNFEAIQLNLTPTQKIIDVNASITKLRFTLKATFGVSPGTGAADGDGFLYQQTKAPSSSWSQTGATELTIEHTDTGAFSFPDFSSGGLAFIAGEGVSTSLGIFESIQYSLDMTVVKVETNYEFAEPISNFWTGFSVSRELPL